MEEEDKEEKEEEEEEYEYEYDVLSIKAITLMYDVQGREGISQIRVRHDCVYRICN